MKIKENIIKYNINISNKNEKNNAKNSIKKIFYKTNPCGISLIVLVITIIVIIILAAVVIITLNKNNPIEEANRARYESDVANIQAIFTNTVAKVMAQNQGTIKLNVGEINSVKIGGNSTEGRINYTINNPQNSENANGVIIFDIGDNTVTTYYTGRKLPLYNAGETTWYVDSEGIVSLKVNDREYGKGEQSNNPAGEVGGEEIERSDNPMLQSWKSTSKTDFHDENYKTKITKVKLAVNVKVPNNSIMSWDVSETKDKSVMAWVEDDGNSGYILTIAGKEKIIANTNSSYLFFNFSNLKVIENLQLLDTRKVTNMSGMFMGCYKLEKLDLSNFNTNNVIDMKTMFCYCYMLENLEFGNNFNTNNVINMNSMFELCKSLRKLDLSNFNTSKVTNMGQMLQGCAKIEYLDLSNIDMTNVTDSILSDFEECNNLTTTINMTMLENYDYRNIFRGSATVYPAKITVNYTSKNSDLVDKMIATKSYNSNVVKGIQLD